MYEAVINVLNVGDVITTYLFVSLLGAGREVNPVMSFLLNTFGNWTFVIKLLWVFFALRLAYWGLREYPIHTTILSVVGIAMFGSAVLWNGYSILVNLQ